MRAKIDINNPNRNEVREPLYIHTDINDIIDGSSLANIAENILNIEDRLRAEHQMIKDQPDIWLRFEMEVGYELYDSGMELNIFGIRLENDKEFEARKRKAEQYRIQAENKKIKNAANKIINDKKAAERELKLYKELKKKYDGTDINN